MQFGSAMSGRGGSMAPDQNPMIPNINYANPNTTSDPQFMANLVKDYGAGILKGTNETKIINNFLSGNDTMGKTSALVVGTGQTIVKTLNTTVIATGLTSRYSPSGY